MIWYPSPLPLAHGFSSTGAALPAFLRHRLAAVDRQRASCWLAAGGEDGNEPPDEFVDPILACVMQDPVILPDSGITVDRNTIERHLLSQETDPFNRSKLTVDMLKPDTELKAKIDAWLATRRRPGRTQ